MMQAKEAKTKTAMETAKEKVQLAIMGSKADDGIMTVEELSKEVKKQGAILEGNQFPVEVKMDEFTFSVDKDGNLTKKNEINQADKGTLGTIIGNEKENTVVKDSLGNEVKVPAGFKIVNPEETVLDGIIIEDISHEETMGSQFVWIPVGNVIKKDGNVEKIVLGRYSFDDLGNVTEYDGTNTEDTKEIHNEEYKNVIAKDIEDFKSKAIASKEYYIARYEARDKDTTTVRTGGSSEKNQLICTAENYVYTYITQSEASNLSRNMYNDSNFESDLMNSYAWDTAITYVQTFDNRNNKIKPYSKQNSLNTNNFAEKGTNKLEDINKQDKICNIYDMASNCSEWSTESAKTTNYNCVVRGGIFYYNYAHTSASYEYNEMDKIDHNAFRPILYL